MSYDELHPGDVRYEQPEPATCMCGGTRCDDCGFWRECLCGLRQCKCDNRERTDT